jgi:hypothetical protein
MRTERPAVLSTGAWFLACAFAALTCGGCGSDDGLGRRYPVSGQVRYKGQPLAKGRINFIPENNETGRAASAEIEAGSYRLTTHAPGDGALPGKYGVSVSAVDHDISGALAKAGGGTANQVDIGKSKRTPLIPPKYFDPATSGLSAEVKLESNTINFELQD